MRFPAKKCIIRQLSHSQTSANRAAKMPTLDFKGKQLVYAHHLTVRVRELAVHSGKSIAPKKSALSLDGNLIIHGDNLHALKALLPRYAGRVNCIYIDPPYNTGNEKWIYNDNVNSPQMREWLRDKSPVDGEDLERHEKWLCMMWPRLQLLRELLSEDGVIFVSIDDNEQHRLRMIMDEIFVEENFVAGLGWQKKFSRQSDATFFSDTFEHILVYAKNKSDFSINLLPRTEKQDSRYKNPDNDPRGPWSPDNMVVKTYSSAYDYPITTPTGRKVNPARGFCWRFSKTKFAELVKDDRIYFGKTGNNIPRLKRFLSEVQSGLVPTTLWLRDFAGDTQEAVREVKNILTDAKFDSPKPVKLLKQIFLIATKKDSIILDSFAGSGTTAHAVLELNKADGGNRKFILVECEDYADAITAERVRRVIKGGAKQPALGGGFAYCTLGAEITPEKMLTGKNIPAYETLANHLVWLATGNSMKTIRQTRGKDGFFHETETQLFYLIYEPTLKFLQSADSALDETRATRIHKQIQKSKKPARVFATSSFIGQKDLTKMGITFCRLPFLEEGVV